MSETTGAPALPATPALEITAGATPSPAPAVPAPEPSPEPAPSPAATPDPATPAAPDPAPAAPAEPAKPEGETPAEPAAPDKPDIKLHTEEPSALSTEEPKPAEPKPGEPAAPEAPVGYEFTFPEGITVPQPELEPFVGVLRENSITPQAGQKLLDMYLAQRQQDAVNTLAEQHRVFAESRRAELDRVKADPELGGAGYETTRTAAARGRDLLLGNNSEHRAEFERFLANTGAGEQLALWRLFVNADRLFRAPAPPATPPTPALGAQGRGPQRGMNSLFRNPSGR